MHIPDGWGVELGIWFMGMVASCGCSTRSSRCPSRSRTCKQWRRSFALRWPQAATGSPSTCTAPAASWVWLLVLMLAVTSVSMNLRRAGHAPAGVVVLRPVTPSPFADRARRRPWTEPIEPALSAAAGDRVGRARGQRARHRPRRPAGSSCPPNFGLYGVGFYEPGNGHGDGGLGNPWLYFDARTGEPAGADVPGTRQRGRHLHADACSRCTRAGSSACRARADVADGRGDRDAQRHRRADLVAQGRRTATCDDPGPSRPGARFAPLIPRHFFPIEPRTRRTLVSPSRRRARSVFRPLALAAPLFVACMRTQLRRPPAEPPADTVLPAVKVNATPDRATEGTRQLHHALDQHRDQARPHAARNAAVRSAWCRAR